MERRGFIKGMLAGVVGATATIKLAEPGEAATLVAQRNLLLAQPEEINVDEALTAFRGNGFEVYAKLLDKGFVPIGYIRSIQVTQDRYDVTSLYGWKGEITGTNAEYVAGLKRISMTFRGPQL